MFIVCLVLRNLPCIVEAYPHFRHLPYGLLGTSANPCETTSESDPESAEVQNQPKTFLFPTNTTLGASSTDHTAPQRPNLEDEANRAPILGPQHIYGVEGNTDLMPTQILQETKFSTPEKRVARRPIHGRIRRVFTA